MTKMKSSNAGFYSAGAEKRDATRVAWKRLAVGSVLCAASVGWSAAASNGQAGSAGRIDALAGMVIALPNSPDGDASSAGSREEIPVGMRDGAPTLKTIMQPIRPRRGQAAAGPVSRGGICPPVTTTHSSLNFEGTNQEVVVQAGMVEDEEAAVSFTIDPAEFPIVLRSAEIVWTTENPAEEITVAYEFRVYEGNPQSGLPIFVEPSQSAQEGGTLPDVIINPVNPAVNLFILIDSGDPDQIVITNDEGTNTFSVGFRIKEHNQPATSNQPCLLGSLPAACAGPPPTLNAFPTTDGPTIGSDPNAPTQNWLLARANCGPCAIPGGWYTFALMDALGFGPSGDWNIRVTYEPAGCPEEVGACCVDGDCQSNVLNTDCTAMGGVFQGDGVQCIDVTCPEPTGACCFDPGDGGQVCQNNLTQTQCDEQINSIYLGDGTTCGSGSCDPPSGACCNPTNGLCLDTTQANCDIAGLVWRGPDSSCADDSCFGVCCLPDGSCLDNGGIGYLEEDCTALGGSWDNATTDCAFADCPDPVGACCLTNGNCLPNQTEADCAFFGGEWGVNQSCVEFCVDPIGACCLPGGGCIEAQTEDECVNFFGGTWTESAICDVACACPGDSNGDNQVDLQDLLDVISNWGSDGSGGGDVNNDFFVDLADLLSVISNWGSSC